MVNINELFGRIVDATSSRQDWKNNPELKAANDIRRTVVDHAQRLEQGAEGRIGYRFPGELQGHAVEYAVEGHQKMNLGTPVNAIDDTCSINVLFETGETTQTLTLFPSAAMQPLFSAHQELPDLSLLRDSITQALIPQRNLEPTNQTTPSPTPIFSR